MKADIFAAISMASSIVSAVSIPSVVTIVILHTPSLTEECKSCIESTQIDRCINIEPDAPTVNTLDEARIVNKIYDGQVRVENLNGTYAMIDHTKSLHIGTVGGEALEYLTSSIERIEKRQSAPCQHNACAIVTNCGQTCAFCYPVVCV